LDLDQAFHDPDGSARRLDRDDELRALHQGRQIWRAHSEMRRRLLLDLEQRAPEILDHLDQALLAPGLGKAQLRPRPDDDIFRSPHQHRPAAGSAEDQFAGFEACAAHRRLKTSRLFQLNASRDLAHAPGRHGGQS
jgi:hypothetical protein